MKSLASTIILLLSFIRFLSNEICFVITIMHSDYQNIELGIKSYFANVEDLKIFYRDKDKNMIEITCSENICIKRLLFEKGYAYFMLTDEKKVNEKITIRYNYEDIYLSINYYDVYFKPYFIAGPKVKIINNIESRLSWESSYQIYDLKEFYFKVNDLFDLKYNNFQDIEEIYLIIEKPPGYYQFLEFNDSLKGYKIPLIFDTLNEQINLYFKETLYYETKTWQPSFKYMTGMILAEGFYILKNESNCNLRINLNIKTSSINIKIPVEIYYNNSFLKSVNNISIFDYQLDKYDKVIYE